MRIGIMGGTFDPIHNGHLMLAEYAYRLFNLDKVWFMPNGNPPHKLHSSIQSDAGMRSRMVELAIKGRQGFCLNLYEARENTVSCTYQTMEYLHQVYEEDSLYYMIGADSLFAIETWVKPERIFPTCTILAAYRDDKDSRDIMEKRIKELKEKYHAKIELLETPLFHVSSHQLREKLKKGISITGLVPEAVEKYIKEKGLYKEVGNEYTT